jgi:hypothetical protein
MSDEEKKDVLKFAERTILSNEYLREKKRKKRAAK